MLSGRIIRYSFTKPPVQKKRRVELVKWFEPISEEENVNKFLVVYEDGTIYIYYTKAESPDEDLKRVITVATKDGGTKDMTVEKIIQTMQTSVENYDFNKHYLKKPANNSQKVEMICHEQE